MNQDLNQKPEGNNGQPYTFSDETTKKKIKRHLSNINDVITEKDIENVKIPGNEKPELTHSKKELIHSKKKKKADKPLVDDTPGNPITPWDVLDEK